MRSQETVIVLQAIKGVYNELMEIRSKIEAMQDHLDRIEQTGVMDLASDDDDDDDDDDGDEWEGDSDLESAHSAPF